MAASRITSVPLAISDLMELSNSSLVLPGATMPNQVRDSTEPQSV
jgi:hypothetical protein